MLVRDVVVGGDAYNKCQANQHVVGGAVLEIDGPVVGGRDAIVYQAVNGLYKKRV